jgi:hypothetical protein
MKKIIATFILMGMAGYASAATGSANNVAVMESSMTFVQVSVASGTTAVDITSAVSMTNRTTIVIQNVDTAATLWCGGAGVLSTTGAMISPGGSISFNVREYSQKYATPIKIYCLSSSTAGATKAAIIQGY